MKARLFTNTNEPLMLVDVQDPEPGPGTHRRESHSLCHCDVALLEEKRWLPLLVKRPITIGHEVAGVISGLGQRVTE